MRLTPSALIVAGLLSLPAIARAQAPSPSPQDAALAQSLFDEARQLMIASDFAGACPKLAESQRLDPALGTLLNLAVCNERLGKTASAWAEYRDAESVAKREGRGERESYARAHAAELEPRLSRLVIGRASGNVDRGLEVRLDGEAVGEPAFGTAGPIDPGAHRVEARAPGKRPWSATVTIDDHADRRSIEIPALEDAPPPAPPPMVAEGPGGGPLAITLPSVPAAPPEARADRRRLGAFVTGGVALTALAIGAVSGMQAIVQWDDRNKLCNGNVCSPAGLDADGSARGWAVAADVGLGVGAVGVAAAAYLFLTSGGANEGPRATGGRGLRVGPVGGARMAGVGVDGVW